MEALLKRELGCDFVKATGHSGGGCISQGQSYDTDRGRVFVKVNSKAEVRAAVGRARAGWVVVGVWGLGGGGADTLGEWPLVLCTGRAPASGTGPGVPACPQDTICLVSRHAFYNLPLQWCPAALGVFLWLWHFPLSTQVNDWQEDWVTFYARQRIQPQMDMVEKGSGDREARELWSALQLKIPDLFRDLDIVPALLHGDLWGGNVAEDASGPIIFDPASFYGHSEYELAIAGMFGGFSRSFYSAYHSAIPEAPGFEARLQLYQLFHYLNHWNHFGSGYRGSSLNIMRNLIK
uniref:protein-ribulosamine 3-kinase n=1 Tax=Ursus americanus TaxID=9643 RepID=A0A452Q7Z2_URSAM